MPKMTKNMSITTDTLTMAPMLRATDFRTNLMPDDLVSALRGVLRAVYAATAPLSNPQLTSASARAA